MYFRLRRGWKLELRLSLRLGLAFGIHLCEGVRGALLSAGGYGGFTGLGLRSVVLFGFYFTRAVPRFAVEGLCAG